MKFTRADAIKKAGLVLAGALGVKVASLPSVAKADGVEGPTDFRDNGYSSDVVTVYNAVEDGTALSAGADFGKTTGITTVAQTGLKAYGSRESNVGRGAVIQGAIGVEITSYTQSHIRLMPGKTNSLPRIGGIGDLYCDQDGRLWFYGGQVLRLDGSEGPGWKRLA